MTDIGDKRFLAVAEATALTMSLTELITRVESETTPENADLAIDTLKYLRILKHKYQALAKFPMGIDSKGHIIPLIGEKDNK